MIYPSARLSERTVLEVHPSAVIGDYTLITVPFLQMKEGSQLNAGARVVGKAPCLIGRHVVVGYNAIILTSSDTLAEKMDDASPEEERRVSTRSVQLDDYSYVGSGAVLMPGTHLEEGALVGALSYVPPDTVVPKWKAGWGQRFRTVKDRPRPIQA